MISLVSAFWLFVFLFGLIGAMRGWAKELLVVFSVILALFLIFVLESYTPYMIPFEEVLASVEGLPEIVTYQALPAAVQEELRVQFWSRAMIVFILSFFGYQTPRLGVIADRARRERIQDFMLGGVMGLVSGFFIMGTLWWYMAAAYYPFGPQIMAPQPGTPLGDAAINILNYFPPVFASNQIGLFFAVVVAFMFVLVVFI